MAKKTEKQTQVAKRVPADKAKPQKGRQGRPLGTLSNVNLPPVLAAMRERFVNLLYENIGKTKIFENITDAAEGLHVPRQNLSFIIKDSPAALRCDVVYYLCDKLGISSDYIIFGEAGNPANRDFNLSLNNKIEELETRIKEQSEIISALKSASKNSDELLNNYRAEIERLKSLQK